MTTIVRTKFRRFSRDYVANCKANAEPLEPQTRTEGTLACPMKLHYHLPMDNAYVLEAVHVAQHRDHKAQSRDYGNRTPTGRISKSQPEFQDLPSKGRGMTRHFLTADPAPFISPELTQQISDSVERIESGICNPKAVQRGELRGKTRMQTAYPQDVYLDSPEAKRVTRTQLDDLNSDRAHIDEENRLQRGPKKKSIGFGGLRDLLEKQ